MERSKKRGTHIGCPTGYSPGSRILNDYSGWYRVGQGIALDKRLKIKALRPVVHAICTEMVAICDNPQQREDSTQGRFSA
jgi:hypothetical protein